MAIFVLQSVDEKVKHKVDHNGGMTVLKIDADMNHANTFICEIVLINEDKCSKMLTLQFSGRLIRHSLFMYYLGIVHFELTTYAKTHSMKLTLCVA